jgi:hypothetical protein
MARFYVPNPGFSTEIMKERATLDGLAESAEGAAQMARNFAGRPWMPRAGAGEQIQVVESGGNVYLVNQDHAAHLKEFGSRRSAPTAPLRRGIEAAGLRFKDEGK